MLIAGIEPATSSLPWMRSAYWAKSAYQKSILQIQIFVNIGLDLQLFLVLSQVLFGIQTKNEKTTINWLRLKVYQP